MTDFLSINYTIAEILGYKMSLVELLGTVTGIVAVILETRSNIWTWPVGIIGIVFSFFVFYQTSLYSDMFLQLYYAATAIYGWIYWHGIKNRDTDSDNTSYTKRTNYTCYTCCNRYRRNRLFYEPYSSDFFQICFLRRPRFPTPTPS